MFDLSSSNKTWGWKGIKTFKTMFFTCLFYQKPASRWWPCPPRALQLDPWHRHQGLSMISNMWTQEKGYFCSVTALLLALTFPKQLSSSADCSSLSKPSDSAEHHNLQAAEKCPHSAHCSLYLTLLNLCCFKPVQTRSKHPTKEVPGILKRREVAPVCVTTSAPEILKGQLV